MLKRGDKIPMQNKRSVFNTKGHTYLHTDTDRFKNTDRHRLKTRTDIDTG